MPNKYDLVVLDMDGTIADTDEMIVQSMYEMYDLYREGRRSPREKIYYFSGPPMRETLKNEFPHQDNDFMLQEFIRISWNNYDKYVKAFPHVKEVLLRLKEKGIKIAIVTGKYKSASLHCLDVMDLNDVSEYMVCGDDVKIAKPDPEGINKVIEHFNVLDKQKVLYIGDNNVDYLTARNAGVDIALVKWGPREIDKSLTPEYWLKSFLDLEDIVYGKNN